jgi:hypothetical protein
LSDFNGLLRHSQVIAIPKPLALSGPAARWTSPAVLAPSEPFQGVGRQNLSQESFPVLGAKVQVTRRPAASASLWGFLKNNT